MKDPLENMTKKQAEKLGKRLAEKVLYGAIEGGHISPQGKSDVELKADVLKFLESLQSSNIELVPVVDHRSSILREARSFSKKHDLSISILFYATYFEHNLNSFIARPAVSQKPSESTIKSMIRATKLEDKMTWALEIMGRRRLHPVHQKIIRKISELRNAFVHYKWQEMGSEETEKAKLAIKDAERTVDYLRRYENKIIHKGQKRRIRKAVSS